MKIYLGDVMQWSRKYNLIFIFSSKKFVVFDKKSYLCTYDEEIDYFMPNDDSLFCCYLCARNDFS